MADITMQPRTSFTGPYGGYGEYGGIGGVSEDGTKGAVGAAGYHVGPNGNVHAGAGFVAGGPNKVVGAGAAYVDNQKIEGAAVGGFKYDRNSGEFDGAAGAEWMNKSTGESHSGSLVADLQKGQGGTITVTKDDQSKIYTIPPRPTME